MVPLPNPTLSQTSKLTAALFFFFLFLPFTLFIFICISLPFLLLLPILCLFSLPLVLSQFFFRLFIKSLAMIFKGMSMVVCGSRTHQKADGDLENKQESLELDLSDFPSVDESGHEDEEMMREVGRHTFVEHEDSRQIQFYEALSFWKRREREEI